MKIKVTALVTIGMKTALIIYCISLNIFTPLFAGGVYAQKLDTKVSIQFRGGQSLASAIEQMRSETKIKFSYDPTVTGSLSVDHKNFRAEQLRTILNDLLEGTNLTYKEQAGTIIVYKDAPAARPAPKAQQPGLLTGTVSDSEDLPLAGANIKVVETNETYRTEDNGAFSIRLLPGTYTVVVTYVSYESQTHRGLVITENTSTRLPVVLSAAQGALQEVVVVGYGSQKRSDITGAISSVPKERYEMVPNTNTAQLIQGAVPGIMIQQLSAGAEPNYSAMVRGRNSITASNNPLVIIDGIPGELNDVNPKDITSIEVLKDASSTAIYGSRGANGVILVTTRSGDQGKARFHYSGFLSKHQYIKIPRILTGPEFYAYKMQRDSGAMTIYEQEIYESGNWVNWLDLALRDGSSQQHNLSVSGGGEHVNYYLGGGIQNIKGLAINDNYRRITARANVETKLMKLFTVGTKTQIATVDRSGVAPSWGQAYYHNPLSVPVDEHGNWTVYPQHWDTAHPHPMTPTLYDDDDKSLLLNTTNYLLFDVPFVQGLRYQLNTGIRLERDDRATYMGRNTKVGLENQGVLQDTERQTLRTVVENVVSYTRDFGKHRLFGTFLYSFENNLLQSEGLELKQFPHDYLGRYAADLAAIRNPSAGYNADHLISQMLRVNYSFDNRYLFTLTGRRDGYSGFGSENKWGFFPSMAFGWHVANESFFPKGIAVNDLKLRVSYGVNGNQAVGAYQTIAKLDPFNNIARKEIQVGYRPGTLAIDNLGWESSTTLNLGADIGLFSGRLTGSLNAYRTVTDDLLLDRQISSVHGLRSVVQNTGKTQNRGFDVSLGAQQIHLGGVSWTPSANLSVNQNKILALYNTADNRGKGLDDVSNAWFIGQPILVNYDWEWLGTWQLDEAEQAAIYQSKPGYVKVRDTDGDQKLSAADRRILGQQDPKFSWGFNNQFDYKDFSLSIFLHGTHGHQRLNGLMIETTLAEVRNSTIWKNWWTPENPTNDWIANDQHARSAPGAGTINWYESAGFIRVKDISLAYSLDRRLLDRFNLGQVRLFINVRNPFTFTKWTGLDPEVPTTTDVPLNKEYVLGLDFSF